MTVWRPLVEPLASLTVEVPLSGGSDLLRGRRYRSDERQHQNSERQHHQPQQVRSISSSDLTRTLADNSPLFY